MGNVLIIDCNLGMKATHGHTTQAGVLPNLAYNLLGLLS